MPIGVVANPVPAGSFVNKLQDSEGNWYVDVGVKVQFTVAGLQPGWSFLFENGYVGAYDNNQLTDKTDFWPNQQRYAFDENPTIEGHGGNAFTLWTRVYTPQKSNRVGTVYVTAFNLSWSIVDAETNQVPDGSGVETVLVAIVIPDE
jgi:hypothetical protein